MFAIRNLAVREGNVPRGILVQARSLFETGRVVPQTKMASIRRERYGLGTEPAVDVDAVKKILSKTSFHDIVYKGS